MPAVLDAGNLYSETRSGQMLPAVKKDLERVYVPNLRGNSVTVIDPTTLKVVDSFKVGRSPQHIVPSWDMRTLWVANNAERGKDGSLTPINPRTGKPGKELPVDDPYNVYFTPDGHSIIIVAEAKHRLDFRDPRTMRCRAFPAHPHDGPFGRVQLPFLGSKNLAPNGRLFYCRFCKSGGADANCQPGFARHTWQAQGAGQCLGN